MQTTDHAVLDQLIRDMDAVMNGEGPGAAGMGEFVPDVMEKLRALVRKATGLTLA